MLIPCITFRFLKTSPIIPGCRPSGRPHISGGKAINKKYLIITGAVFVLILSGEVWLPLLEEIIELAFEWAHKTLDLLYAHVFGLDDEAAPKASAWTGLFLLVGLAAWGGYALYRKMPQWWATGKADFKAWWLGLPWHLRLAYIAGGLVMLGILAMFI